MLVRVFSLSLKMAGVIGNITETITQKQNGEGLGEKIRE